METCDEKYKFTSVIIILSDSYMNILIPQIQEIDKLEHYTIVINNKH